MSLIKQLKRVRACVVYVCSVRQTQIRTCRTPKSLSASKSTGSCLPLLSNLGVKAFCGKLEMSNVHSSMGTCAESFEIGIEMEIEMDR